LGESNIPEVESQVLKQQGHSEVDAKFEYIEGDEKQRCNEGWIEEANTKLNNQT
jgi:hypothetical protein